MIFLKPLKLVVLFFVAGGLGFFANIAQLTNFNVLDFVKNHAPQSYIALIAFTTMLYLIGMIIEFFKKRSKRLLDKESLKDNALINVSQSIHTGSVENSTIIQVGGDYKE